MSETALAHLTKISKALQQAKTFDDFRDVRVMAKMGLQALKANRDARIEDRNELAEYVLRAEIAMGQIIDEGKRNGDIASKGQPKKEIYQDGILNQPATLKEVGITPNQSSRFQALASIPEEKREQVIQETKEAREELTQSLLLQIAKKQEKEERRRERIDNLVEVSLESVGRFPLIYADPPWQYDFSVDDSDQIENHYPTMTLEEICAVPVSDASTDDCVLLLWATSPKLEEAFAVLKAWGFTYRTCAIWDKDWIGPGYYFRQRHELLLVATKGRLPVPLPENRPDSIFTERRTKHSKKPEIAYQLIERMYSEFPKLELFARQAREGWKVWGNEAEVV